jgi:uncharacterized protein
MEAAYSSNSSGAIHASPVQQDWEEREFVEVIQLNILQIASFLNDMETTVKNRLATLSDRLVVIERQIQFVEANVITTLNTSDTSESK